MPISLMDPLSSPSSTSRCVNLVTLIGLWPLQLPWVMPCVRTWSRIHNITGDLFVVSDGTLTIQDLDKLQQQVPQLKFHYHPAQHEEIVAQALSKYPALSAIRKQDLTWRKLLDCPLVCSHLPQSVLLIDTDVIVRRPVLLPSGVQPDQIVYMQEDISAYQGNWIAPFKEPMVKSFNAGLVLFQPQIIDLSFLEYVVRNYLQRMRDYWTSEQFAWSLLAGRMKSPRFWEGKSAGCMAGFGTRTHADIIGNKVKFFSGKKPLKDSSSMQVCCGNIPVIHMAGPAKHYYETLMPGLDDGEPELLESREAPLLDMAEKVLLAGRLVMKGLPRKFHSGTVTQ